MKNHLVAIALCFAPGAVIPGLALAGPKDDIAASLSADVTNRSQVALIEIASQAGWSCSGQAKIPEQSKKSSRSGSGSSDSRSGGGKAASLRLKCSDGSNARAEVKRDSDRKEWRIDFRHKDYGRADLRAREN